MILLTSKNIVEGQIFQKEFRTSHKTIIIKGITCIGGPNKKFNEDGFSIISTSSALQIFLVDGGTQIEPVESLGELSGGKYIAEKAIEFSKELDPSELIVKNLKLLNAFIGKDIARYHQDIVFSKNSLNTPYGSIVGIKIDTVSSIVEIANAGDAFCLAILKDRKFKLLTKDNVYLTDQETLRIAKEVARLHGVSVKDVLEKKSSDFRFRSVVENMEKEMRQIASSRQQRITGSGKFEVVADKRLDLQALGKLLVFSDGAVNCLVNIRTREGRKRFAKIVEENGIEGLYQKVVSASRNDPDFEKCPRFRNLDDFTILEIIL